MPQANSMVECGEFEELGSFYSWAAKELYDLVLITVTSGNCSMKTNSQDFFSFYPPSLSLPSLPDARIVRMIDCLCHQESHVGSSRGQQHLSKW